MQHTWNIIQDELMKMFNDLFGVDETTSTSTSSYSNSSYPSNSISTLSTSSSSSSSNNNQIDFNENKEKRLKFRFLSNVDEKNELVRETTKRTSIFLISDYTNFTILNLLYLFKPITKFVEDSSQLIDTKDTKKLIEFINQNIKERLISKLRNDYKTKLDEILITNEAFQPNLDHQKYKTCYSYELSEAQPILLVR